MPQVVLRHCKFVEQCIKYCRTNEMICALPQLRRCRIFEKAPKNLSRKIWNTLAVGVHISFHSYDSILCTVTYKGRPYSTQATENTQAKIKIPRPVWKYPGHIKFFILIQRKLKGGREEWDMALSWSFSRDLRPSWYHKWPLDMAWVFS